MPEDERAQWAITHLDQASVCCESRDIGYVVLAEEDRQPREVTEDDLVNRARRFEYHTGDGEGQAYIRGDIMRTWLKDLAPGRPEGNMDVNEDELE